MGNMGLVVLLNFLNKEVKSVEWLSLRGDVRRTEGTEEEVNSKY